MNNFETVNVERNLLLKHPFTMMVAGATSSGKTVFVRNLLKFYPEIASMERFPVRVFWVYGAWQKAYEEPLPTPYVKIEYGQEIPESLIGYDMVVLDDVMESMGDSKRMSDLFTKESHHSNVSIIFIVQNVFHQGRKMRNITLNSQYIVLTKNRRDLNQVKTLGMQLYGSSKYFHKVYKKTVIDRDYGYLLIDLTPQTQENVRLRSHIFPFEYPIRVYPE